MNMIITTYNTTDDLINKLQNSKGKTKLKIYKKNYYYDELNIRFFKFEENFLSKNA